MMKPLADLPEAVARDLLGVFTDIDDTLDDRGPAPGRRLRALERLHLAGLAVVPITGRPAGWCDMVARFWPVAGVVGENGAFYFRYDEASRNMIRRFVDDVAERAENRLRLAGARRPHPRRGARIGHRRRPALPRGRPRHRLPRGRSAASRRPRSTASSPSSRRRAPSPRSPRSTSMAGSATTTSCR